jgi:hypothetical protein
MAGGEDNSPEAKVLQQQLSEVSITASQDATLRQWLPFSNFGDEAKLAVHGAGLGSYERALVKFAGADIAKQLAGRELESATLELRIAARGFTFGHSAIAAHRMLRTWEQASVTWACRNETTPSNPFSIDCAAEDRWKMDPWLPGPRQFVETATDTQSVSWLQSAPVRFNVTPDVNFLLADDARRDLSFMLRNTKELNGVWLDFNSLESSKPPKLILNTRIKPPDELVAGLENLTSQLVRIRYAQAAPGFDPNAATPTTNLEQRIERDARALIDSVPPDLGLEWNTDLADQIRRLGAALNGLMVVRVPLAIGHRPAGRCSNLIIARDLDNPADKGSFVSDYFRFIAIDGEPNSRAALSALTGVQEGIHCLTTRDLSYLERGYVGALYEIMKRLREKNSSAAAHAFWDRTLPLSFILFDATKYFQFPLSLWAIRFPIDPSRELPRFSFDFAAANEELPIARDIRDLEPWDDTLLRVLYCRKDPESNRYLDVEPKLRTLGRFGLWTEDIVHDGALTRLKLANRGLCQSLHDLTEVLRLGAGDCSLYEMSQTDFKCASPGTCFFEILPDGGIRFRPGSPLTQFGTFREEVAEMNCQDGETIPPAFTPTIGCIDPRRGGGFFSPDPELDRLMRCTLRPRSSSLPGAMSFLRRDQGNVLCRDNWARDGAGGDSSSGGMPTRTGDVTDEEKIKDAAKEAADKLRKQSGAIGQATVEQAGQGNSSPGAAGAVSGNVNSVAQRVESGDIRIVNSDLPDPPGQTKRGDCCTTDSSGRTVISVDLAAIARTGANLADIIAHEATHHALDRSTSAGTTIFSDAGKENIRRGEAHHDIMKKSGVYQCAPDEPSCGNPECTQHNAMFSRLDECLQGGGGGQPLCLGLVDRPCIRIIPPPSGCFVIPDAPAPTVCQAVLCGPSYQTSQGPISLPELSVGLARDCCGGGDPGPGSGGGECAPVPGCKPCCFNCVCPPPGFSDPAVPEQGCIGCTLLPVPGPE